MRVDKCYWLKCNALKQLQQISNFGTSSSSLSWSTSCFIPDNFSVSEDNNANL